MFIVSFYGNVFKPFIQDRFKLFKITAPSCKAAHFFGRFGHKMIKLICLFTYKLLIFIAPVKLNIHNFLPPDLSRGGRSGSDEYL